MSYLNKSNCSSIPNQWFFLNPSEQSNEKLLSRIKKDVGVVFFHEGVQRKGFYEKIKPYIVLCKKKKIKFIIPDSLYWVNKYKANGVFINNSDILRRKFYIKKYRGKFQITTKVHNFPEALLAKKNSDLVFLSPVFKTNSYPKKIPLPNYIFISLCFFLKEKVIFGLGGVNLKNFSTIKNKYLFGFGGISFFREKNE